MIKVSIFISYDCEVKSFDHDLYEGGATQQNIRLDNKQRAFSLDLDKSALNKEFEQPTRSSGRKYGRQASSAMGWDAKVIVVWLESYEDQAHFPFSTYIIKYFSISIQSNQRNILYI